MSPIRAGRSRTLILLSVTITLVMVALSVGAFAAAKSQASSLSFLSPATYSSGGDTPQSVAIGDLNGDGKPDLVVGNYYPSGSGASGPVGVLLGNGDGTFQPVVTYPSGGEPNYNVVIADVNHDGKPDIIVSACAAAGNSCGSADGIVSVLLGNGDGTFQPAVTYSTGAPRNNGLAVADVNGDGILDIIATNYYGETNGDGTISVLLGNGDGTFQNAVNYDAGTSETNGVAIADVNGDGKPDVVAVSYTGLVSVLLGNGNGTFQAAVTYPAGGSGSSGVVIADINADGKPDLIVANLSGTVGILLGVGNGTFQSVVTYNGGGAVPQLAVADVNEDGNLDIVTSTDGSVIGVLLGNGNGTFQSVTTFPSGGSDANTLAVGDVNGDGKPDIVVTNGYSNSLGVLLNNTTVTTCTGKCSTSTTLASSLNPSIYGQKVTFTATVTTSNGTVPTGKVSFTWGGIYTVGTAKLENGVATLTSATLNADTFPLTAVYKGDSNNLGSTSPILSQVVNQATSSATLKSSPNPSNVGQAVTFDLKITSATVTPKGPVTFTNGNTVLGTVQLHSGKATLSTSSLPAGSDVVTATFNGDSDIKGSSATVTQVVGESSSTTVITLLYSADNSSLTETFTANVTSSAGTPTGTVTLTVGDTVLGTPVLNNGQATLTVPTLTVGSNTVTATYYGNAQFGPGSAWITQTFVMPVTGSLYLQQEGGSAAATTTFGLGTSPSNFVAYYTGLPNSPSPTGQLLAGTFTAGTLVNFGMYTTFGSQSGWAFSTGTDQASLVSFADLSNSLGMDHGITQQTSSTTWLLHLDDALSYLYDDDNNDVLMQLSVVSQ
jgi:hypothetical protein